MTVELSNYEMRIICAVLHDQADEWDIAASKKGSDANLLKYAHVLRTLRKKLYSPFSE